MTMQTAMVDASEILFPPECVRCGRPADAVHEIGVTRGFDLIVVGYWRIVQVPIPVCTACRRRRRIAGVLCFVGALAAIFVGGGLVAALAIGGWSASALVVAIPVIVFVVVDRCWHDDLVEWWTLGVRLVWKKGPGTPLRVRFRRTEYFLAWANINPGASLGSEPRHPYDGGVPITARERVSPHRSKDVAMSNDPTPSDQPVFGRTIPAVMFLAMTAVLALHHWYVVTQGSAFFIVLFGVPMLWTLALAGIFYPPVFYSIGKYGRHLPKATKVAGALIAFSGLGVGFYLAKFVYGMF